MEGRGVINWEHEKGPEDVIGAIIYAKKINSLQDCETERQKLFFDLSAGPYVYIIGELYDGEDHPGAVAAAAMVRYYHKRREKMFIGWSVEGQTLVRKGNLLDKSVGRRVAFTLRPCNKSAFMGVFEDPKMQQQAITKFEQTSNIRSFEVDSVIVDDPILDIRLSAEQLAKTLTAGSTGAAPSTLVGGSALSVEDRGLRNRVKAAVRDWDRTRPLKETIKAALPEVSDSYVDHFTHLAEELSLRKGIKPPARIGAHHLTDLHASDSQKKLVEGLYLDEQKQPDITGSFRDHKLYKLKNDAGQNVIVEGPYDQEADPALRSAAYSKIMSGLFGLGEHVAAVGMFRHPKNDTQTWLAQEIVPDAKPAFGQHYQESMESGAQDGSTGKLTAADLILGTAGHHVGDTVIRSGKPVYLKGLSFVYGSPGSPSEQDKAPLGPEAVEWARGIDSRALATEMAKAGLKHDTIRKAVTSLRYIQQHGDSQSVGTLREALINLFTPQAPAQEVQP